MDKWKSKQDEYLLKDTCRTGQVSFLEIFGPWQEIQNVKYESSINYLSKVMANFEVLVDKLTNREINTETDRQGKNFRMCPFPSPRQSLIAHSVY